MHAGKLLFVPLFAALLPFSAALAQSPGPATTGSLNGSVTDAAGTPLAAAKVRYMSVAPSVAAGLRASPAPDETVVNGAVTTDANGNFTIASLPSGMYLLCAGVPSAPYLDSCVWGQALRVIVSRGGAATGTIALQRGVYLNVRIDDPMQLLPQVIEGPWTSRKLLVGVTFGTGAYQGAINTGVDSSGRNYQLVIPSGTAFSLWLYSADVILKDASGTVLSPSATARISFQASAGEDQNFTFTVSGSASSAL